jgi:cellulose synthase/poly-beta-1,6-N-acetylglucosamine synthase-like glycosyltransferase
VNTGLVTVQQIAEALTLQQRTGGKLGEILLHTGAVGERELVQVLAEQLRLPQLDVSAFEPEEDALRILPEPLARRHRIVPLAVRSHVLYLAMTDPLDGEALAALREHTMLPIRAVVTSRSALDALLQRVYRRRYIRVATADLLNRAPDESAYRVLSGPQKVFFIVLLVLTALSLLDDPVRTFIIFNVGSVLFYTSFSFYKFKLISDALRSTLELPVSPEEVSALDERTLPIYTILVPLYREANVVHALVDSIAHLDYPKTKLDVKLICEEDDRETVDALRALDLPPHFRIVIVPDAQPKTKPKACNYGLIQAEGKYVVIFDAEDRPERDQLKKIIVAFRRAEDRVVCIQCKLNYYNRSQNILTRWFTAEYSHWFDLLMPGLDAADAPIPLGGTSNHFITERLVELGAWDPFNVTEDADLGIRLHKGGYKTAIIDSTTFEEANSDLYNWVRQRSRWVKGYIQTWLVHMRHPLKLMDQIGFRSWISFQMIIGGTFVGFLLNPIYWLLTTSWILTEAHFIQQIFPGYVYYAGAVGLFLGNFVFTYINVAGVMRRGHHDLVKYALLSPLYWALMSIGAWKGFLQLFYRPYYWEKTVHGLDVGQAPSTE